MLHLCLQTLTNVNKLHKATKAAIKEVKLDVHEPPEVQRGKLGPHGHVAPSIVAGLKSAFN